MDTTLPIIAKCTTSEIAILAFISGITLSTMIPFLVPFLFSWFKLGTQLVKAYPKIYNKYIFAVQGEDYETGFRV